MKKLLYSLVITLLFGCTDNNREQSLLRDRIDNLEKKLSEIYKPGFGESMEAVRNHHAKLWLAGVNKNWKLAEFEIHELTETAENIEKYQNDRKETQLISMLFPALDSLTVAINLKDELLFEKKFTFLTKTCNECHKLTTHEFVVIKQPENNPFENQRFEIE